MNETRSPLEITKEALGIKTEHWPKPIPPREFDWCAYYDGDEESGQYGYGRTEQAAVDDLTDNWPR